MTQRRLREEPDELFEFLNPEDEESEPLHYIDLDKAWHGIHYLLTGKTESDTSPLGQAVLGGQEVGDEVGYGPARFLTPEQVREIAQALDGVSEQVLRSRFQPKAMAKANVYPDDIWERDGEEALEYVAENYKQLVAFYSGAASRGDGVIAWHS